MRPTVLVFAFALGGCQSQAIFEKAPGEADSDLVIKNASTAGDIFAMPLSKLVVDVSAPQSAPATKPETAKPAPAMKPTPKPQAAPSQGALAQAVQQPKPAATQFRINSSTYSFSIVPVESEHRYLVKPATQLTSSTSVNITKIPNTDIPSSVAVTFTDNTKARIDQVGGLITAVAALLPLLAGETDCKGDESLPPFTLIIDGQTTPGGGIPVPGQNCWTYRVVYESQKPATGTVSWSRFEKDLGSSVSYFPVPACRDVSIYLKNRGMRTEDVTRIQTRVADPDYIRLAPLPQKGQIAMHPICGADVSDTAVDRFGGYLDNLAELLSQAQKIESAAQGKTSPASSKK